MNDSFDTNRNFDMRCLTDLRVALNQYKVNVVILAALFKSILIEKSIIARVRNV